MALFTKAELVSAFADHAKTTKAQAERDIDFIFETIKTKLMDGDNEFRLPEIGGTLKKVITPAHEARNPRDGSTVQVKAKYKIKYTFKPQEI